jgi:hypothetical protein
MQCGVETNKAQKSLKWVVSICPSKNIRGYSTTE